MARKPKKQTDAEIGTIRKRWTGKIRVALAYPNVYSVGMSNLGFHTVYRLLNDLDTVVCERIFLPDESSLASREVVSRESAKPLSAFHVVAFSIAFENDYPNLLTLLEQAGLPLQSEDRHPPQPLVVAGGVACMLNPEPISPFVDGFLIGEAEALLPSFIERLDPGADRRTWLMNMARHQPGFYVPRFYSARYREDGTLSDFQPLADVPEKIRRVSLNDLSEHMAHSAIVTPHTTFDAAYLVEVSRGCPHGCRFCAAGYIFRPPRFRSAEQIEACITDAAGRTDRIGLVGAAVSDHPDIGRICIGAARSKIRLSFSSLRADALSPELLSALKTSGVKTATIAPDAGSDRLRRVINKGLEENDILGTAERLVAGSIPNLKIYFMVGLPTETDEDVEAIVSLCKRVKHRFLQSSRTRKRIGNITVSLSCFVPKPSTPFQWAAMDGVDTLNKKIKRVRQGLRKVANVRVHADVPRWAYIQGVLSRGDRKVARLLLLAHRHRGNWPQTLKATPINPDFYVRRERAADERLPWDFIDSGIRKSYLLAEYKKAKGAQPSDDCRVDACSRCGVCGV